MSTRTVTGDSNTIDTTGKPNSDVTYVLGLAFAIIFLLCTLSYASYKCRRDTRSSSPPEGGDDQRFRTTTVSRGVGDDVLKTFPEFVYSVYSEVMMAGKGDSLVDANGSGCSICLADYKPADVIRLLPECGHLFHRKCIDKWLRVHPSCPVCRNSPLPVKLSGQRS